MKEKPKKYKNINLESLRFEYRAGNYDIVKKKILALIDKNFSMLEIKDKLRLTSQEIGIALSYKSNDSYFGFGYKDEAYYTEEEMLSEYKYNYSNLSYEEKEIYKSLKK